MTENAIALPKETQHLPDILAMVGEKVALKHVGHNRWRGLCPFHKSTSPSFYVYPETGEYHCFGCQAHGNTVDWFIRINENKHTDHKHHDCPVDLSDPVVVSFRKRVEQSIPDFGGSIEHLGQYKKAMRIWRESRPSEDSLVANYLVSCGIKFSASDWPDAIRFHPYVLHEPSREQYPNNPEKTHYPAMLAAVRGLNSGFVGIYRTYLTQDGRLRADIDNNPRMLGQCYGNYIHLGPIEPKNLIITPDLETALILRRLCPDRTVWCSMSLGNMKAPLPQNGSDITLVIDERYHDQKVLNGTIKDAVRIHKHNRHKTNYVKFGANKADLSAKE